MLWQKILQTDVSVAVRIVRWLTLLIIGAGWSSLNTRLASKAAGV